MIYLVFNDEKAKRFWQVEQQKMELHIAYGKVGHAGRQLNKTFATEEKASIEADKLVAQKIKKGYQQTQKIEQPITPKLKSESTSEKSTSELKAESKTQPMSDSEFCAKPSESMIWDDTFDAKLPIMRGIKTAKVSNKLVELPPKQQQNLSKKCQQLVTLVAHLKDKKVPPNTKQLLDTKEIVQDDQTQYVSIIEEDCIKLIFGCLKADWRERINAKKRLDWLIKTFIYDMGVADTLSLFFEALERYYQKHHGYYMQDILSDALKTLRHHVAVADEDSYQQLEAIATAQTGYRMKLVACFIFAHEQDWANNMTPNDSLTTNSIASAGELRQGVFYAPNKIKSSLDHSYASLPSSPQMLMSIRLYGLDFVEILDALLQHLTSVKKYQKELDTLMNAIHQLDSEHINHINQIR